MTLYMVEGYELATVLAMVEAETKADAIQKVWDGKAKTMDNEPIGFVRRSQWIARKQGT